MDTNFIFIIGAFLGAFVLIAFIWKDIQNMEAEEEFLNEIEDIRPKNERIVK